MTENKSPQNPETPESTQGEEKVAGEQGEATEKPEISKEARTWGMLCHLAGLAGFSFPAGGVILPLIFWQLKKDQHPFVDEQGKEALNFQISMTIYALASIALIPVLCIGVFLLAAVSITDLVLLIIAAVKAHNGESYRYPLAIRLIK